MRVMRSLASFAWALLVAAAILAVEFALSYPIVGVYAVFIAPGHPTWFYANAAAQWIVPWWIHIGGTALFFAAGAGASRWGGNRPWFVAAFCVCYLLIELASFACLGGLSTFLHGAGIAWLALQFAAAFLGWRVAYRARPL